MAQAQNTLSPTIMATLLQNVAQGKLKPANLRRNINADSLVTLGDKGAKYTRKDGRFYVSFFRGEVEQSTEEVGDRVEAQMLVIDYLTSNKQPA
jgi:hypothetical protein